MREQSDCDQSRAVREAEVSAAVQTETRPVCLNNLIAGVMAADALLDTDAFEFLSLVIAFSRSIFRCARIQPRVASNGLLRINHIGDAHGKPTHNLDHSWGYFGSRIACSCGLGLVSEK